MDAWPSPPDSQLVAGCARPGWRPGCAVGLLEAGVREGDGGVSADAGTGLLVGAAAATTAPAGAAVAAAVSPATGSLLFNIFLLAVVANTLRRERARRRQPRA